MCGYMMEKKLFLLEIEKPEKDNDGKEVLKTFFYSFVARNLSDAKQVAAKLYPWPHKNLVEIPMKDHGLAF